MCVCVVDGEEKRRIGSIADYDPINENYGSLASGYQPKSRSSVSSQSYEWQETVSLPQKSPAVNSIQLTSPACQCHCCL